MCLGARAQHAERTRKERTLAGSSTPPLGGGEHVELPSLRSRPGGILAAQHDVGPVSLSGLDLDAAAAERCSHAVAAQPTSLRLAPWISWSAITAGAPRRAAEIALAAAIPPDIVVMQGMPRATAAVRI